MLLPVKIPFSCAYLFTSCVHTENILRRYGVFKKYCARNEAGKKIFQEDPVDKWQQWKGCRYGEYFVMVRGVPKNIVLETRKNKIFQEDPVDEWQQWKGCRY